MEPKDVESAVYDLVVECKFFEKPSEQCKRCSLREFCDEEREVMEILVKILERKDE